MGICAQWKKIKAKPMEEILHRLEQYEFLRIIIFPESTIHEKPIEEWPFCHVLISFHSKGFPLAKTQEYARLHQPFLINDLDKQWDIMDRVKVHEILVDTGIPQPRYGVLRRQLNDGKRFYFSSVFYVCSVLQMEFGVHYRMLLNKMIKLRSMVRYFISLLLKSQSPQRIMMCTFTFRHQRVVARSDYFEK